MTWQVQLRTPTMKELQATFAELDPGKGVPCPLCPLALHSPRLSAPLVAAAAAALAGGRRTAQRHMGLDDKLEQGSSERFLNQRVALGKKVQQRAFVPLVRPLTSSVISSRHAFYRAMSLSQSRSWLMPGSWHAPSIPDTAGEAVRQVRHPAVAPARALAPDAGPA